MRRPLLNVGLILMGLLAMAEVATRVVLPAPQPARVLTPTGAAEITHRGDGEGGQPVYATSGRRLRTGVDVVIEHHELGGRRIEIRTNELGFRQPPMQPKGSRRRVLFLGDSITFADSLREEETFVRLVETRTAEDAAPLETTNAGVVAISLVGELTLLQEVGLSLRPDVVVLCVALNDAQPSRTRLPPPLPGWLARSRFAHYSAKVWQVAMEPSPDRASTRFDEERLRLIHSQIAEHSAEFVENGADDAAAFYREVLDAASDWGSAWSKVAQRELALGLRRFSDLARRHGFTPLVVALPVRAQVEADRVHDEPQRWLRTISDRLKVPMLDLLPALREGHMRGEGALFYDHRHYTPHGSSLVADALVAALRQA